MNSIVSALRFFFTQTIDRPDLARKLIRTIHPRNLPIVLSRDEVTRLLNATTCLKHPAAAIVPRSMTQLVPNVISCDSMVDFDHHSNTRNRHAAHHCHNSATCQPRSVSQTSSNASPETNSP
jgi:hypothetical protein